MEPNNTNPNINTDGTTTSHAALIGVILVLLVIVIGAGTYLYYNKAIAPSQPEETATTTSSEFASNCGIIVDQPTAGAAVSFPLTVTGRIDNTDADEAGCRWTMFEGQGGKAELSYETKDGWSLPEDTQPIKVADWTATSTTFSTTLNFDNSTEQLPSNYNFKIVLTEENPSGDGTPDQVEIPVVLR